MDIRTGDLDVHILGDLLTALSGDKKMLGGINPDDIDIRFDPFAGKMSIDVERIAPSKRQSIMMALKRAVDRERDQRKSAHQNPPAKKVCFAERVKEKYISDDDHYDNYSSDGTIEDEEMCALVPSYRPAAVDPPPAEFIPFKVSQPTNEILEEMFVHSIELQSRSAKIDTNSIYYRGALESITWEIINEQAQFIEIWSDFGRSGEPSASRDAVTALTYDVAAALNSANSSDAKVLEIVSAMLTKDAVGASTIYYCSSIGIFYRFDSIIRQMLKLIADTMNTLGRAEVRHPDYRDFTYLIETRGNAHQRDMYYVLCVGDDRRIIELTWIPGEPNEQEKQIVMTALRENLYLHNLDKKSNGERRFRRKFKVPAPLRPDLDFTENIRRAMILLEARDTGKSPLAIAAMAREAKLAKKKGGKKSKSAKSKRRR